MMEMTAISREAWKACATGWKGGFCRRREDQARQSDADRDGGEKIADNVGGAVTMGIIQRQSVRPCETLQEKRFDAPPERTDFRGVLREGLPPGA